MIENLQPQTIVIISILTIFSRTGSIIRYTARTFICPGSFEM